MENEIVLFKNQTVKLKVNIKEETVWLTQKQMSELFDKAKSTINEHIKNIYAEKELIKEETMKKFGNPEFSNKPTNFYNLDVIISVGYRVKSRNGIIFRKWANQIIKSYILEGYAINRKRLDYLEKTIDIINVANRITPELENNEASEMFKLISIYTKALNLLDDYDKKELKKPKGNYDNKKIEYKDCLKIINQLRFKNNSKLFAMEKENGLSSIINDIYQSYDGEDLYETIEEKAAHLLYFITKNHVFIDGNKRIAATLFIYFLNFYDILYIGEKRNIENNTLTALTLLIAESKPTEKEIIISLIMNFLNN